MLVSKTARDAAAVLVDPLWADRLGRADFEREALIVLYDVVWRAASPYPPATLAAYPYEGGELGDAHEWACVSWHDAWCLYAGRRTTSDDPLLPILAEIIRLSQARWRDRLRKAINRGYRLRWPNSVPVTDRRRHH